MENLPRMKFFSCVLALLIASQHGIAAAPIIPAPPQIAASGYLLIDADTRRVLVESNANEPLPPASLTKIMTSYVAAVEVESGRISLEDQVPISVKAWRTPGSRMFIQEGRQVALKDLLKGVVIQSGNDASVAVAEHIAGSESAFADMMNQQAQQLGMLSSYFINATGLPAEGHVVTAADLALLTNSLIRDFPEHYAMYAQRSFEFNGIDQPNRNRLLWKDRTVDGVKTGHTNAAGYCLVSSALRNGMRLIAVVMGTKSDEARMQESLKLLSYGFRYFETRKLYEADIALKTSELWYGEDQDVALGLAEELFITIPRGHYDDLEAELKIPTYVEAPLSLGQEVGELRLRLNGELIAKQALVALSDAPEAGVFSRMSDGIYLFFADLFGG